MPQRRSPTSWDTPLSMRLVPLTSLVINNSIRISNVMRSSNSISRRTQPLKVSLVRRGLISKRLGKVRDSMSPTIHLTEAPSLTLTSQLAAFSPFGERLRKISLGRSWELRLTQCLSFMGPERQLSSITPINKGFRSWH